MNPTRSYIHFAGKTKAARRVSTNTFTERERCRRNKRLAIKTIHNNQ